MAQTLLYLSSLSIVDYISAHPINWVYNTQDSTYPQGYGDQAGSAPTTAVEQFCNLLIARRGLFTQAEFTTHCFLAWGSWVNGLAEELRQGLEYKLFRNFYPALIDSLHAYALLIESRMFDAVVLDSYEDSTRKTDLLVTLEGETLRLALLGPKSVARQQRGYKEQKRNFANLPTIEVVMPAARPKAEGNKRWFRSTDFLQAIALHYQGSVKHRGAVEH